MEQPPDLPEPVGPKCPYCDQVLEERPQQTTNCPLCDNPIHVRTEQRILPSTLLTEDQARLIDFFERPEDFGVGGVGFRETTEELAQRFGKDARSRAVLWSVLNQFVSRFVQAEDLQSLSTAYYLTARLLHAEGKDWLGELQAAARVSLLHYQQSNLADEVEIATVEDVCEACSRLAGRILTIDEALRRAPLPCKECTHDARGGTMGFCRCSYIPKAT